MTLVKFLMALLWEKNWCVVIEALDMWCLTCDSKQVQLKSMEFCLCGEGQIFLQKIGLHVQISPGYLDNT
jgi:hypothetical protein